MKLSLKVLSTALLLPVVLSQDDPCADDGCIDETRACTDAPGDCCEGFECHGFTFFKRCQETPMCLKEWYACNPNPTDEVIPCCEGFTCVTDPDTQLSECQKPTKRTVELPGFNIEEHVDPTPTPPPITADVIECPNPTIRDAKLTGDPHFRTFDGLTYDCQGIGEHIIFQSTKTSRMVQGRFTRVMDKSVSVTHGVAMRDQGGNDVPRVQVSIPIQKDETEHTVLGTKGCALQLFVEGEQHSLVPGVSFESDQVTVSLSGTTVTTTYKSGFKVRVSMGYWNGCLLNTYIATPMCGDDEFTGLLGDYDGNPNNDWIAKDGSRVPIPDDHYDRRRKPAYDFCTENWCLTQATESIFHYNEFSYDFDYYSRCKLEYGQSLVEFIADLPKHIVDACKGDVGCMMDTLDADEETITQTTRAIQIEAFEFNANECGKEDSDCSAGNACCEGHTCLQFAATTWKCKKDIKRLTELNPQCNPYEGGYCSQIDCCGDRTCQNIDGVFQCKTEAACTQEGRSCQSDTDCCGGAGLQCVNPKKGKDALWKTCTKVPTGRSAENEICFEGQKCEDGLFCDKGNCSKERSKKWGMTCWEKGWEEEKDCGDDLVCTIWYGRKVCADPGLEEAADGTKKLRKGALCPVDGSVSCKDGLTCQAINAKNNKCLAKKLGAEQANKYGQCLDEDIQAKIDTHRKKRKEKFEQWKKNKGGVRGGGSNSNKNNGSNSNKNGNNKNKNGNNKNKNGNNKNKNGNNKNKNGNNRNKNNKSSRRE